MNEDFLHGDAVAVARRLLGCELLLMVKNKAVRLKIVETEAYHQSDAASHSYRGKTPRNSVMFGPSGHLYVYFTYGMHYCMNIVTGQPGEGSAVLVRAAEPLTGETELRRNRAVVRPVELTNGPAKLCQALGINMAWNGHDLRQRPLQLVVRELLPTDEIVQTERIGISQGQDQPWRFYIRNNVYVSRT